MLKTLASQLELSPSELDSLLSLRLNDLLKSPLFKQQLDSVDTSLIKQTLPTAGICLAENFPFLYKWLKNEFEVDRNPEKPDEITSWMCHFFTSEESLKRLSETYGLESLAPMEMERMVPDLIALFDNVPDAHVRQEWQKAIALLSVVLVVTAREEAVSRGALI